MRHAMLVAFVRGLLSFSGAPCPACVMPCSTPRMKSVALLQAQSVLRALIRYCGFLIRWCGARHALMIHVCPMTRIMLNRLVHLYLLHILVTRFSFRIMT